MKDSSIRKLAQLERGGWLRNDDFSGKTAHVKNAATGEVHQFQVEGPTPGGLLWKHTAANVTRSLWGSCMKVQMNVDWVSQDATLIARVARITPELKEKLGLGDQWKIGDLVRIDNKDFEFAAPSNGHKHCDGKVSLYADGKLITDDVKFSYEPPWKTRYTKAEREMYKNIQEFARKLEYSGASKMSGDAKIRHLYDTIPRKLPAPEEWAASSEGDDDG